MNCKPGDLAVLVRVEIPELQCNIGKMFTVVKWNADEWELRSEQPCKVALRSGEFIELPRGSTCYGADSQLRPIRPQGDDAVDEMVRIVGKPKEVHHG